MSVLISCGGSSNPAPPAQAPPSSSPTPTIQSISPAAIAPGTGGFTLSVNGSGFVQNSTVQWNGASRPTTYVSSAQLTAAIAAADVASGGTVTVLVATPGGGTSQPTNFAVQYPLPSIASLSPSAAVIDGTAFTLTVLGSNLYSGATVSWNHIARVTTFVSSTELQATILASDLGVPAGVTPITVANPSPSAGISNVVQFQLDNPSPTITSISPDSGIAGAQNQLTVDGANFQSGAIVQLDGKNWPAFAVSATQLSVNVRPATIGTLSLTVTNPAPSVGPSTALPYTNNPAGPGVTPTVVSIDPAGAMIVAVGGGMSSDARYVSFGLYERDTCTGVASGCTPSTVQFWPAGNGGTFLPSDNGRFVAIGPSAYLKEGGLSVRDSCLGAINCVPTTIDSPYNSNGGIGGTPFSISSDGRYVPFAKLFGTPPPSLSIYDFCSGAPPGCAPSEISVGDGGSGPPVAPVVSSDARYAVFLDWLPTGPVVMLRDTCIGVSPGCTPTSQTLTTGVDACLQPTISHNGSYLAYSCGANTRTLYVAATCVQGSPGCSTTPVSFNSRDSGFPLFISDSGRYVTYQGTSGGPQTSMVWSLDTCIGVPGGCTTQTVPACVNQNGAMADSDCYLAGMTSDGRYVLYYSSATDLVNGAPSPSLYLSPNPVP